MKRLFVSAALLPLAYAASAGAETKITTATTTPVATATAANGQPDDITVESNGSVKPTAPGVAVTLNSNNVVKNAGTIGFDGQSNATGVLILGGRTGSLTNTGLIGLLEDYTATDTDSDGDLDGPFAQGSNRIGVRVTGPDPFNGDIRNEPAGAINIEGNDSAGIRAETRINGHLANGGAVTVTGDRGVAIYATAIVGNAQINGTVQVQGEGSVGVQLGDVGGGVRLQGVVSSTGYRSAQRLADAARAKLDVDDLKQGGGAVRITGNVGGGVLLDVRPADNSTTDTDEDDDGIADAQEGNGSLTSVGAAPALDIGAADRATTIGVVGAGDNAYGLVLRGEVVGAGLNDGVAATGVRVGQAGGGATTVQGGIHVLGGRVQATAFGADVTAEGGSATAILLNAGAVAPALRNSGSIEALLTNGSQDARAVVDLSGTLSLVENTGVIRAISTPKSGSTRIGQAIALDLRANTSGATVRQTKATSTSAPSITGDVLFGSGADRLEIAGGTMTGAMAFGAGADSLVVDAGGVVTGRLTDTDGRLTVAVGEGRLAVTNTETIQLSALSLGAKSVLAVTIDGQAGTATRFNVAGATTIASGAQFDLNLASLLRGAQSYEIVRTGDLQVTGGTAVSVVGAPWLYRAELRTDTATDTVAVDIRPKTAAELGLNRSQSQAYAGVFEALDRNAGIEAAFLAQKDQAGFERLYDQLLPDHSGGAIMSAQAISMAISAAIAHRNPDDAAGGSGLWAQEIIFQIDRDAEDALGFESEGFGLAAGFELVGVNQSVGINGSFVSADFNDKVASAGERVAMNFVEGGLYWRLQAGGLQADVRGGLGYVSFDSKRILAATDLNLRSDADWNGWLAEAHAGVSYQASLGWLYARPELSVDYLRLSEDGYTETGGGDGFDLTVEDRKGDLLTGQALLAIGARFGDEFWWSPEVKVGWRAKLSGDPGQTTARFGTGTPFTLDAEDVYSGGAVARIGVRGGTNQVLYAIDGGGTFDDGYSEYDLRAVVRFLF
ncbi:autotransporter outer membrane beta-barrel domain-containing protein [Phenylobacterium sp.]|uniref:autotransporter outer membrane beta-barrel domain-containing protein n=1 Tax=Phenylobacterium sp. TaxID=1871053 RepID=UPI002D1C7852|nr:autotransporter outer membrane beta-barrel domain-containing protein [Phenylobacterium sp.]HVI32243.1 autotransporter outer membrane beta-barrel domain-containing protein [Phenylobacterium sp.]